MPRRPPQMHARAKYDFGNMLSKNWTFTIAQNVTVLEKKYCSHSGNALAHAQGIVMNS